MSCATGKSQKTSQDFYKIALAVEVTRDDKTSNFLLDFFITAEQFYKVQTCKKFQEVDVVFAPTAKGYAQILSVEPL